VREIVAAEARRREIARFTDTEPRDVDDPEVVASAWR
jgi:hypothetical protein